MVRSRKYGNLVYIIYQIAINATMELSLDTLLIFTFIVLMIGFGIGAWITRLLLRYPFGAGPMTGKDAMIGRKARVVGRKQGYLRVFINSQVWNAESPDIERIKEGDSVRIKSVENLTLIVEPLE